MKTKVCLKYFVHDCRRASSDKVLRDKHLILLKIQIMMDINVNLLKRFLTFLIKSLPVVLLKVKLQPVTKYIKTTTFCKSFPLPTSISVDRSANYTETMLWTNY